MKALNFPKSHRLLRPADYGKVFNDVQLKVPHRNFLILATPNNLGHARVGLVFAKKNLKLSVQRNRIKRQVRETFRHQPELPGMDIIVLGRQGLASLDNQTVSKSLNGLWQRLTKKYHQLPTSQPAGSSSSGEGKD
ncbi:MULTISPECIES: ribonuclease P protein component [unclassified Marinobacter]|uniref:ribonuclease P protein component n=1 Tax=unclassified Marinobacter TaxID=83889 RepID=UPI0026E4266F|nr:MULTISPECIES: ribonuclease P protein component [unclassified Marinobacter]MDO6441772.1 ribonuclease P protein component [Marinobacter sp. 2_MG-2023]MDO6824843.1 ribonuclease P protein component [Marinobacter sp. 1_MG-2023]